MTKPNDTTLSDAAVMISVDGDQWWPFDFVDDAVLYYAFSDDSDRVDAERVYGMRCAISGQERTDG